MLILQYHVERDLLYCSARHRKIYQRLSLNILSDFHGIVYFFGHVPSIVKIAVLYPQNILLRAFCLLYYRKHEYSVVNHPRGMFRFRRNIFFRYYRAVIQDAASANQNRKRRYRGGNDNNSPKVLYQISISIVSVVFTLSRPSWRNASSSETLAYMDLASAMS